MRPVDFVSENFEEIYEFVENNSKILTGKDMSDYARGKGYNFSDMVLRHAIIGESMKRGIDSPKSPSLQSLMLKEKDYIMEHILLDDTLVSLEEGAKLKKYMVKAFPQFNMDLTTKAYREALNEIANGLRQEVRRRYKVGDTVTYLERYGYVAEEETDDVTLKEGKIIEEYDTYYLVDNGNYKTTIHKN